jgi:hypothetical protein
MISKVGPSIGSDGMIEWDYQAHLKLLKRLVICVFHDLLVGESSNLLF